MEAKYIRKNPAGTFLVTVERTVKHDTREKMHYEYACKVEPAPSQNDFIDLFARLVCTHGKLPAKSYAAMMGVGETQLTVTLAALSGAGIREWTDAFAGAVAEKLLRDTDWKINRIAETARFTSPGVFSRFFRRRYKCTPQEWRWSNR